jgi:Zn-dependent M16 (insulinase) family peptidase
MRLRANLHEADWAEEHIGGITYLRFLRELADGFGTSWPTLKTAMERIRSLLLNRAALLCNVTTDAASWRCFEPELASFLNALPSHPIAQSSWRTGEGPRFEALAILRASIMSARVPTFIAWARPSGAAHVVVKYLRTTWLWDKVRVQAGRMVALYARSSLGQFHLPVIP